MVSWKYWIYRNRLRATSLAKPQAHPLICTPFVTLFSEVVFNITVNEGVQAIVDPPEVFLDIGCQKEGGSEALGI